MKACSTREDGSNNGQRLLNPQTESFNPELIDYLLRLYFCRPLGTPGIILSVLEDLFCSSDNSFGPVYRFNSFKLCRKVTRVLRCIDIRVIEEHCAQRQYGQFLFL